MKIEQEIQQTQFRSPWVKALINLMYTHNSIEGFLKEKIEPYGITLQQFNVLRILRGQHPNFVSINLIRERMIDKMSDTSRLIDRLENKKYVEKFPCKKDRRLVDIRISESGLNLLKDIDRLDHVFDNALCCLSEDEAAQLSDLLDKVRNWHKEEDCGQEK